MRKQIDVTQVILALVAIALLAVNAFLIVQNTRLRNSLEQSKQLVTDEGYRFSELAVRDLEGGESNIALADAQVGTVLLIFNTSCEYCLQQYPYWVKLTESIDQDRWRVIALTSENDAEKIKPYVEDHKIPNAQIATMPLAEFRKARMLYTPMTLVIDRQGEVKKVWPGLNKDFVLPN